jgi:hypothetical protein
MSAVNKSYTVEIFPLDTEIKLIVSGNYDYYPTHPMQFASHYNMGSDESVTIDKILLEKENGKRCDITEFYNHIVWEWNDGRFYKHIEEVALEHCRSEFMQDKVIL